MMKNSAKFYSKECVNCVYDLKMWSKWMIRRVLYARMQHEIPMFLNKMHIEWDATGNSVSHCEWFKFGMVFNRNGKLPFLPAKGNPIQSRWGRLQYFDFISTERPLRLTFIDCIFSDRKWALFLNLHAVYKESISVRLVRFAVKMSPMISYHIVYDMIW